MKSLNQKINSEEFIFDYRRAIYWPKEKILISTDLHWGKTTYMQKHGIPISDQVFDHDLKRLEALLKDYETSTFLVLGDLVHHEQSLTAPMMEKIAYFRHQQPCELLLIEGNHDRYAVFPESWGILTEKSFAHKDFYFTHDLKKKSPYYQFAGHLHPMLKFYSGHDSMRLPSFILTEKYCLLPAFSYFTGGQEVRLLEGHKGIAVTDEGLELFIK